MKSIKTTLLLLMTIITFYDGRGEDLENVEFNITDNYHSYTQKEMNTIWIGADIGLPGMINTHIGVYLDYISIQAKVGLIYPYYKTADIGMYISNLFDNDPGLSTGIKYGYLEHNENIYRYLTLSFVALPVFQNLSGGLEIMYLMSDNDILFPVIPYITIGYAIGGSW